MTNSAVALALVAVAGAANAATVTTYNSQASFLAAAGGGLNFENFEGYVSGTTVGTLALSGLTFTTTNGANQGGQDLYISDEGDTNSIYANVFFEELFLEFSPGATAFGADTRSELSDSFFDIFVTLDDTTVQQFILNVTGGAFFGFTVTGGTVSGMRYSSQTGTAEGLDNVYWGQAGHIIPLPTGVGLACAGLGLVGLRRRR